MDNGIRRAGLQMIRRFPRIMQINSASMNRLWKAVEKVAKGEPITVLDANYLYRWRLEYLTRKIAKQSLRDRFDGHFRFPRVTHDG
jgi:hypothetical protein